MKKENNDRLGLLRFVWLELGNAYGGSRYSIWNICPKIGGGFWFFVSAATAFPSLFQSASRDQRQFPSLNIQSTSPQQQSVKWISQSVGRKARVPRNSNRQSSWGFFLSPSRCPQIVPEEAEKSSRMGSFFSIEFGPKYRNSLLKAENRIRYRVSIQ